MRKEGCRALVGPGTTSGFREARLLARACRRPARRRCPGVLRTLLATRICSSRLALCGEPRAAVGAPGAHGELQAAVVAVTGAGRPVATRLACRDGIPVHPLSAFADPVANAIGARASAPAKVARPNVLRMFFTSVLSPSARRQRPLDAGADAVFRQGDLGRAVSVRHGRGRQHSRPTGRSHPVATEGAMPPPVGPTHTQVRGFEIICSFSRLSGPYKPICAKSYRITACCG